MLCLSDATGAHLFLETVLILALFGHKHKPKTPPADEQEHIKLIAQDRKIVENGITGAEAFEADVMFAQYERPEIDAFEHQLFKCAHDDDEHLDADVDTLIKLGDELMAVDAVLHHEEVI